ncbi:hypothetical protein [Rathayibacter sp. VKM Ac-2927]|uniref:hypothetical protein n=1 Tax=Rathayibacter sp. VKM Ac-2927 TaxID=2929478 RepID=UPI001FB22378|nr:hypothetical protein [Rathayibacter sp. VKM Ac-2927]MCJ1688630.1 hypothetical protein [Rathayibacter sp. VKM Ac-2927]
MSENDADGGVEESTNAALRTALTVAIQLAEKFSRLREQMLRDAERRDAATAREMSARFDAQRGAAVAELAVVDRPQWWENATVSDIARVAETAQMWRGFNDRAAAAADTIGREVQNRYGVDVSALVAQERAKAVEERAEASQLVTEADRLDGRAQDSPVAGETATDVVVQLEAQALAYDAAAGRGGEDGKTPDELRDLAGDARAQAQLHRDAAIDLPASAQSGEATAARADAGNTYDSAERREAFAASLTDKGISAEDVKARLRADVDQARPPAEVLNSPKRTARVKSPTTPAVSQQRQRGDRSR